MAVLSKANSNSFVIFQIDQKIDNVKEDSRRKIQTFQMFQIFPKLPSAVDVSIRMNAM